MQSSEFPEYKFVKPRGYSVGRSAPVSYVVLHTTEGAANSGAAENGAAYDARRTDDVSTHFFVDNDTVVQCVLTKDTAWTARAANGRGIQIEMCGRASTTNWIDGGYYQALLKNSAKLTAKLLKKYGLPARYLTNTQLANGEKGITTHRQVTAVLGGTHTDPGPNFPYDYFLGLVRAELGQTAVKPVVATNAPAGGANGTAASSISTAAKTALLTNNKEKNMRLVQLKGKPEVYLSNLLVRRWIKDATELEAIRTELKKDGYTDEQLKIIVVTKLDAYGILIK